jgi:hypothetical protein
MELDDFSIMIKGYFDKRKRDELNFANVGAIIDGLAAGLSSNKFWSYPRFIARWFGEVVPELTKEEKAKRSAEMMKRVKLNNKILEEKEKLKPKKDKQKEKKKNAKRIKNNN